jgi:ATP-dependent DNA helicase RecG
LLRHYPRRYHQRGELTDLASLREGEHVTVLARVDLVRRIPMSNQRGSRTGKGYRERLEAIVTDGHARLVLTFFHRVGYVNQLLRPGRLGLFAGEVSSFRGQRQLIHPDLEMLPDAAASSEMTTELAAEYATQLIPVYPASAKMSSWKIAKAIRTVLDTLDVGEDPLPEEVRERFALIGREEAIRAIHLPLDMADIGRARRRLKWDEAFVLQAALAQRRQAAAALHAYRRAAAGGGDDLGRPGLRLPHAPAAAGGGRLG